MNHLSITIKFCSSYTALDYAAMNGHEDCVEILTQAGALFTDEIRTMAAVCIQTAYRAHQ